ncbi:hypothetical protein BKP45_09980 [Anaerobacillus alkalidiazotrophicus]|uniref:Thioredoxin domain-containing protein n=1 Tax=Anaerobacillus alkalidiazotrophicus TaxID=472963 RepID=A0A1S2M745_9BACI|nr:TlpA disulfide reductase family protein [Anaerobacillus alkalidiazotrophicus]OIJ20376.1 hypothetical protein BKP45_09980 [Anaerobacillus alkalidiazotrophicus]
MSKNRIVSFSIALVAFVFIVYVFVENLSDGGFQFTSGGREQVNDINQMKTSSIPNGEIGLQQGMYAPDFTLPVWGTDEEKSLSSFHGQIVVLNLWASWCPPCRDEMPDLIKLSEEYKDQGVQVLGMNMATFESSEEVIKQFIEEYNISFPNFLDQPIDTSNQRGVIETLYQVRSIPVTYILDEEGRIVIPIRGKVNYEMLESELKKILD